MQLGELPGNRQPEPQPAMLPRGCRRPPGGTDRRRTAGTPAEMPRPGVADRDLDVRVDAGQAQLHLAAARRELDRVRQQVPDDLLQAFAIAGHRRRSADRRWSRAGRPWRRPPAARWRTSRAGSRGRSTGATSRRSLPEMMRETSSTSSMICLSAVALRSTISSARVRAFGSDGAAAQHPRVAEHRVERRAQLVRQRRQEFVL